MQITAYELAQRFVGIKEINGTVDNPQILSMLKLDADWPDHDEVPWCSAFVNYITWLLRLPRSKSLRARSWLEIGTPISLQDSSFTTNGYDVIIIKRKFSDPGSEVIEHQGHVGFFNSYDRTNDKIYILGGNQNNTVNVSGYDSSRFLGIRRLYQEWNPNEAPF